MGTRGFMGLVIDETEKIGYMQYDSYPSGVGVRVLEDLRSLTRNMDELTRLARELAVVNNDTPPLPSEIENLKMHADLRVSEQSYDDWYCLLRETHGQFGMTLGCGYIEDHHTFPTDSLFCEWGYLVDLDKGVFEVYEGFQKERPTTGRWAGLPDDSRNEYYAVKLVGSWPLDALPTDEELVALEEEQ